MRHLSFLLVASLASAQDFKDIKVEKVSSGFTFTEGPIWSREGFLLWSDVPSNRILKLGPGDKQPSVFRENSHGANGNTYDAKGNLYTCESRTRRVTRTDKKGTIEVMADKWEGKRLNAPNDIVVRHDGNVYFTDPAFGEEQNKDRDLDFYGIYRIPQKGPMELVARWKTRPNGIAFSPNGKILYVANSDDRNVSAFDVDSKGAASNERVVISEVDGSPDGIRVDEKGNVYVTAKGLAIYSAQGKLLHTIELAEMPRNCTWGDGDLGTLYMTAMTSIYRVRLNVKGSVQY